MIVPILCRFAPTAPAYLAVIVGYILSNDHMTSVIFGDDVNDEVLHIYCQLEFYR